LPLDKVVEPPSLSQSLVRQGRCEEALAFAEERLAQERQAYDQREIGRFCEDVLIRLDRRDEAYARYGLSSGRGSTYLATWRDLARRYPERDAREILIDLMALHGNLGKWFAAAKDAGFLDLAQQCAADPNVEPATLLRAARDAVPWSSRHSRAYALRLDPRHEIVDPSRRPGLPHHRTQGPLRVLSEQIGLRRAGRRISFAG